MGRAAHRIVRKLSTWFLLLVLTSSLNLAWAQQPASPAAVSPQQQASGAPGQQNTPAAPNLKDLPDSPGALLAQANSPQTPTPDQAKPSEKKTTPVGTAAAEEIGPSGVAASRPAGMALAPMKQKRVHLLLIKVGLLAAAGVAIGTTVALSKASPGSPPGTH